jgi:hypothetical protein
MGLLKSLMNEGLDDPQVWHVLGGQGTFLITKTSSRSILGSMNDLAFQIKCMIDAKGGLANSDLCGINRELNRIPMGAIKYSASFDELKRRLAEPKSGSTDEEY